MDGLGEERLRILVADGQESRLAQVSETVSGLGHEVIPETGLETVPQLTAEQKPDVAIVIVGESSVNSLAMIRGIVQKAACPVIAVLDVQDRAFVNEAAKQGIFAYVTGGGSGQELQSSIDVVLQRFAEYHNLEGAFGRRSVTERAKGVLMERHGIEERAAFNLLRAEARRTNRKVVDVAEAVLASHRLLPAREAETEPQPD